jgi:hypothetical protein
LLQPSVVQLLVSESIAYDGVVQIEVEIILELHFKASSHNHG